ncbi:MAG: hypothetical protein JNL70_01565 [Saprospiraceae bacterium]|nr:hypothetical protein [Saprospiraceae bacterium]
MKKTIFSILVFLPLFSFAQQNSPVTKTIDSRLYDAYGKTYVDAVAQTDAFLIKRWTYYLDHAFYVTDELVSKDGKPLDYPSVSVPDLAHINILILEGEQNLKRDYYVETIYQIKGTNKFLVYHSGQNFIEKLNEHLNEEKKADK